MHAGPVEPQTAGALRAAVARELHDGAIRDLTYSVVRLEAFRAASDNPGMQAAISEIEDHARTALASLRRIIGDLRDQPLEEDLVASVRRMVESYAPPVSRRITLLASPTFPDLIPGHIAVNLARTIQEALSNAVQHSSAENILIELRADRGKLVIEVSDDGCGISGNSPKGSGMIGMRERVALLGGRLTFRHRSPGTAVHIEVPVS